MENHYGHRIRVLHWCMEQAITAALAQMDLTAAQGRILGYLAHRNGAPCSKDIEEAFQLSHPTVSGLLSRLEKKGFLEFRPDETDRRCKRIYILPKGHECNAVIFRTICDVEKQMAEGFSEEERRLFMGLLDRAIQNIGSHHCCKSQKEDSQQHD